MPDRAPVLPQLKALRNMESEAVLTGFVGPKAYSALQAAGIKIFDGLSGSMDVRAALKQYADGLLSQCSGANARKGVQGRGRS